MTSHPNPKHYQPSQNLLDAQRAMEESAAEAETKRHAYRAAIADELRASGLPHAKMAEHTPYTGESVRLIAVEYGVKASGGAPPEAGTYAPSKKLCDARQAMEEAAAEAETKRHAYRKAIADELRASGLSQGRMAEHTPYTAQTVKGIATEYGVPPKRRPTVRSIKS